MKYGQHYRNSKFDALEVIQEWHLNFTLGNVLKYIQRSVHTQRMDDLLKALWYLTYEVSGSKEQADKVVESLETTWGKPIE
jgi:hypothetical protein